MALNYHHLRYFWAVAHDGNLTRTAKTLNVSQSALSLQIKKLEDYLGQQLFERRGRQLVVTEAGRIVLAHADVIFSAGEDLLQTLSHQPQSAQRSLRIGALSTLSRNFQIGFLRPFVSELNNYVRVLSGSLDELLDLLSNRRIDMVLTDQAPVITADAPWVIHPLAEQRVSLVAKPGRVDPEDGLDTLLQEHPLLLPTQNSSIRLGFDALLDSRGINPNVVAEIDDMALLRLLALEDIGLTLVPPIVVEGELQSQQLVEVFALPQLTETFYAVTQTRRFPNPAVHELLQTAEDLFQQAT